MALLGNQVTVSGTAQQLTSSAALVETLIVKALEANANPVYVGELGVTTATGYPLYAGEEFVLTPPHGNLQRTPKPSEIYVIGTASDKIAWIGTRR